MPWPKRLIFSLATFALALWAYPGCGPLPEDSLNGNADQLADDPNDADTNADDGSETGDVAATVVRLYEPEAVPEAGFSVTAGDLVELHWDTDGLPDDASLVCVDLSTDQEVAVAASAASGTAAWTVPASLDAEAEYEFRVVSSTDGTVHAASATFSVSAAPPADNGNAADDTAACSGDADCDDGIDCNGTETCVEGVCTEGVSSCPAGQTCNLETGLCEASTCQTDADCAEGELCAGGVCIAAPATADDLQGLAVDADTGEEIDFSRPLAVGTTISLEAPDPVVAAARLPAADCTCAWSVETVTAGTFSAATECASDFTVTSAGTATVSVVVTCTGATTTFSQDITAEDTSCTEDADCAEDQVCQEGHCTEAPPPTPSVTVLDEQTRLPFVVRFDMRLHDAEGEVIAAGVDEDSFRVYEDDAEIDLTETNMFVTPGENLPLRVVVVLDYSASISAAGAVGAMIDAAAGFVQAAHFTATHYLGVVEFHDRTGEGEGFSLVVPLTKADPAGEAAIVAGIPAEGSLESGLTRVWDAIDLAIRTLDENERQPGEVRAVVFLTDGYDTSSDTDAITLTTAAQNAEIRLYPIGFGDTGHTEPTLQLMADETGGTYFPATQATLLTEAFAKTAFDLRGQWTLTYITQRNSGMVNVRVEFDWEGTSATHESSFDASAIEGDVHQGIVEILDRSYDAQAGRTEFTLKAAYVPRNVDRLLLQFAHSAASFVLQSRGGLLDPALGWTATALGDGVFELSGPTLLEFGAFGNLGTASVPGEVPCLQVTHDDSVYDSLPQPKTVVFEGDLWSAPYTLTVSADPPGSGTVTVAPEKSSYGHGEQVTLTAASSTMVFDHWTGAEGGAVTTVTMDGDESVTAVFLEP